MELTALMVSRITQAATIAAPIFYQQEWKWRGRKIGDEMFVPDVDDIVISLTQRILDADDDTKAVSSGRLMVTFSSLDDNEGSIYLSLGHFKLSERSSSY